MAEHIGFRDRRASRLRCDRTSGHPAGKAPWSHDGGCRFRIGPARGRTDSPGSAEASQWDRTSATTRKSALVLSLAARSYHRTVARQSGWPWRKTMPIGSAGSTGCWQATRPTGRPRLPRYARSTHRRTDHAPWLTLSRVSCYGTGTAMTAWTRPCLRPHSLTGSRRRLPSSRSSSRRRNQNVAA